MMLGEGAAIVVLEPPEIASKRGVNTYAMIGGHTLASEAYHPTAPLPDGRIAARAMQEVVVQAEVSPEDIDYINLHGTGTRANDEAELRAISLAFGRHAPNILLSATKSMHGHALGAAGSIEFVATCLAVAKQFIPPTIHLSAPIKGYEDWSYVRDVAIEYPVMTALSNSFGFAGNISTILLLEAD
jgi:3-oxoacyl-(acyl-carrier-protein) synthase